MEKKYYKTRWYCVNAQMGCDGHFSGYITEDTDGSRDVSTHDEIARHGKKVRIFETLQEASQAGYDLAEEIEPVLNYSVEEITDIDDEWDTVQKLRAETSKDK